MAARHDRATLLGTRLDTSSDLPSRWGRRGGFPMLTPDQLGRIMPNLPAAKAALFLPHLNAAMTEFGIDTMVRTAAFVAQLAHESGEFRWMEEIWGPTDAQRRYEPPSDLAKRL